MKRLKNFFLALIVSPEIIIVLLVGLWFYRAPDSLGEIGEKLKSDPEVWKYLPSLILVFSGAAFHFSSKIRAPLEGASNRLLYEWPLYQLLVDRVIIGLFFSVCSSLVGFGLWFCGRTLPNQTVGGLFLLAAGVSGITAFTMMLSYQKIRELLGRYT